ncbi:DNA-binding protein [Streptomyces tendae]|uniref:DNA-binding protein n=1 Tax=Streptomyces tendae TaxID=1932 RepID=UPI0033D7DE0E
MTHHPGLLRTAPLQGETTSSLICRIAGRYGMEAKVLRACWKWRNYPPGHEGGGMRADAEVLLNTAGRRLLAGMCGVEEDVLARALPSWGEAEAKLRAEAGDPVGLWRTGGAVAGPVAFGCRLCTARRTGAAVRVVRYTPRWERVCVRHGRWLLDADAGQPLEHLDLRGLPEVVAAQRRWASVSRRALRAGTEPERVFALAQSVVARWWEQAYGWERETIWPRRLHSGAGRPRALPADGMFCRRLGERLGRGWLGPLAATDHGGPLIAWMGSVIRLRRGAGGPPGYDNDPWWLRQEHRAATMAGQLRVLGKEKKVPGSGTMWRAAVPAEQRRLITSTIDSAEEQLLQLRGVQSGPTAEVARRLLRGLGHSAGLIENAWKRTAVAAVNGGVPLEEVARWVDLPVEVLRRMLTADRQEDDR